MNLVEAVGEALAQRYALGPRSKGHEPKTPITEPKGLQARMRRIMDKFKGNRREAAKAVGVPYSTWNHLLAGRRVSKKNLGKITDSWFRLFISPARALRVKKVGYPGNWLITAVVVAAPGGASADDVGMSGSRYVNGHGSGVSREDAAALDTEDSGYRTFKAEGLDSAAIVNAWLDGGDDAAAQALLDEIEETYGEEFGFEGDNVEVGFDD